MSHYKSDNIKYTELFFYRRLVEYIIKKLEHKKDNDDDE